MTRQEMEKIQEARLKWFLDEIDPDYILETRQDPDFTEFISSMGGDVTRYRVYGDTEADFRCYAK